MLTENIANRLLKPWTAKGLLIYRYQADFVEVEVPYLALDLDAVVRAVSDEFRAASAPSHLPKLPLGASFKERSIYHQQRADYCAAAESTYSLAAAVLAHRQTVNPTCLSRIRLGPYLEQHFYRGGLGVVEEGPVDFFFSADCFNPVIYATDAVAEVARFTGNFCLSIRVTEAELNSRVEEALTRLKRGDPPPARSQTNMENWLSGQPRSQHEE